MFNSTKKFWDGASEIEIGDTVIYYDGECLVCGISPCEGYYGVEEEDGSLLWVEAENIQAPIDEEALFVERVKALRHKAAYGASIEEFASIMYHAGFRDTGVEV